MSTCTQNTIHACTRCSLCSLVTAAVFKKCAVYQQHRSVDSELTDHWPPQSLCTVVWHTCVLWHYSTVCCRDTQLHILESHTHILQLCILALHSNALHYTTVYWHYTAVNSDGPWLYILALHTLYSRTTQPYALALLKYVFWHYTTINYGTAQRCTLTLHNHIHWHYTTI